MTNGSLINKSKSPNVYYEMMITMLARDTYVFNSFGGLGSRRNKGVDSVFGVSEFTIFFHFLFFFVSNKKYYSAKCTALSIYLRKLFIQYFEYIFLMKH